MPFSWGLVHGYAPLALHYLGQECARAHIINLLFLLLIFIGRMALGSLRMTIRLTLCVSAFRLRLGGS